MTTELKHKIEYTGRGFELIRFHDGYGLECTLQQSSATDCVRAPGATAVWLGTGDTRMHLDREMVEALVANLRAWLDTGSFNIPNKEREE